MRTLALKTSQCILTVQRYTIITDRIRTAARDLCYHPAQFSRSQMLLFLDWLCSESRWSVTTITCVGENTPIFHRLYRGCRNKNERQFNYQVNRCHAGPSAPTFSLAVDLCMDSCSRALNSTFTGTGLILVSNLHGFPAGTISVSPYDFFPSYFKKHSPPTLCLTAGKRAYSFKKEGRGGELGETQS